MTTLSDIQIALEAYKQVAPLLRGRVGGQSPYPEIVDETAPTDFHTNLDQEIENIILGVIRAHKPHEGICAEESGTENETASAIWHIDPIDGTTNLLAGRPEIAVSIARHESGRCTAALIGLPTRGVVLSWQQDGKLLVNEQAFAARPPADNLLDAYIGGPGDLRRGLRCTEAAATIPRIAPLCRVIRLSGALAYDFAALALGELDGRYNLHCKPVDFAAGAALLESCGGVVTDYNGHKLTLQSTSVIAARTESLHRELYDALHST